jgi:hypothetical protein
LDSSNAAAAHFGGLPTVRVPNAKPGTQAVSAAVHIWQNILGAPMAQGIDLCATSAQS